MINKTYYFSKILDSIPVGARLYLPKDVADEWEVERHLDEICEHVANIRCVKPEEKARDGQAAEWVFERARKESADAMEP